jgi:hypothetical protein
VSIASTYPFEITRVVTHIRFLGSSPTRRDLSTDNFVLSGIDSWELIRQALDVRNRLCFCLPGKMMFFILFKHIEAIDGQPSIAMMGQSNSWIHLHRCGDI